MALNHMEAEQAVVGALLIDCRCLPQIRAALRPEDFGMAANRALYRAALRLDLKGEPVDPVTVLEECRRGGEPVAREYLLELMDLTPTAANVEAWLPIVRENALRRGVAELAARAKERLADEGERPADILAELHAGALALEQEGADKALLGPFDLALRWMDHRLKVEGGNSAAYVPTGYRDLDLILGGGLIAGGMHVLAARPGMGKTTFALNIADRVAAKVGPVLFVSLEMDDEQITAKRIARESGISGSRLLMKNDLTAEESAKMAAANDTLLMRHLYINAKATATVAEVGAWGRQVPGLRLIVIDYLGLLEGSGARYEDLYQKVTANSKAVKQLARAMKVPVLCLSQINRESEKRADKQPNLADLRESGAIEQDADTVIFLYRPKYYGDPADRDPNIPEETTCIVAKNRHGGTGKCTLAFYAAASKFVTANPDPRIGYRKAVELGQA